MCSDFKMFRSSRKLNISRVTTSDVNRLARNTNGQRDAEAHFDWARAHENQDDG